MHRLSVKMSNDSDAPLALGRIMREPYRTLLPVICAKRKAKMIASGKRKAEER